MVRASVRGLPWQETSWARPASSTSSGNVDEFGINLTVLRPGQPMTMYHREGYQEGFLVLRGECLLIVEGAEVRLREWDYFIARKMSHTRSSGSAPACHSCSLSVAASAQTGSSTAAMRWR